MHFDLASGIPAVEADPSQMQQVFMNLALNAAEAIGDDAGVVSVATGEQDVTTGQVRNELEGWPIEPGPHVFLEVRDTGCGMDAEARSRIYDPFFSTKFQGRGLGLAAVAGIVRSHKGAIRLVTAPGGGCVLPSDQGSQLSPAELRVQVMVQRAHRPRLLGARPWPGGPSPAGSARGN